MNTEPKKYSGGTVSISVALPYEVKQKLDELAEQSRISRNRLIVNAICLMIKQQYGKE
jgi:predicted transcriptional regulator